MLLFIILALILVILIGAVVCGVAAAGATGIIIFGDVIVCIVFIILSMRWLINRKR